MLGFFFVDAIEGNEEALREEREKLRRRKAREERCAQTHAPTRGTRTHKTRIPRGAFRLPGFWRGK